MLSIAYTALASMAAPFAAAYLLLRPKYRPLLARFAPALPDATKTQAPLWLHACSVGEVNIARPFIEAAQKKWPQIKVIITVSTISGRQLAEKIMPDTPLAWMPFDHPACLRPFLRKLNPRALVLLDTELWPALIAETTRAKIPVILANGRVSDKHFPRYKKIKPLIKNPINKLSAAAMQNQEYAARIVELGANPDRVHVCGSTKFDGLRESADPEKVTSLRKQCGFKHDQQLLIFGSTRPGDEEIAAICWQTLREKFQHLTLIVAPRHIERIDEAIAPFKEPVQRRSAKTQQKNERIFFLDTVGELVDFYAMANVAVVGGSFSQSVNGHNPLEPAALGVPTVFGPHMRNFIDPARELIAHKGAIQTDKHQLLDVLLSLLENPEERKQLAENAQKAVKKNQGAVNRTLDIIQNFIK